MKKVVDCFIFYNELTLLRYRLALLDPVVDHFVLVESRHTHVGNEKELYYDTNKEMSGLAEFAHKIVHVIVDDFPHQEGNLTAENSSEIWQNENFQRIAIKRGLAQLSLDDDDVFTICDLDEIPDPTLLSALKTTPAISTSLYKNGIHGLEMDFYYYNLTCKFTNKWNQARVVRVGNVFRDGEITISTQDMRMLQPHYSFRRAGWHLSYFGDAKFIQNKIQQFSHQELNTKSFTELDMITDRVQNARDLYDRTSSNIQTVALVDNDYLPPMFESYLHDFIHI